MDKITSLDELNLTKKQRAFIEHYVELGGRTGAGTKAAIMAGYASTGAASMASNLLRDRRVLDGIRHLTETKVRSSVILGMETLIELAETGPAPQRLKAAVELIDRGGMLLVRQQEMNVNVNDTRSTDAVLASIKDLASQLGISVSGLTLDGEAVDITPEEPQKHPGGRPRYKRQLVPGKLIEQKKAAQAAEIKNWLDFGITEEDEVDG